MLFCTMNIPNEKRRGDESNEQIFLNVIDLFMGEYPVTVDNFSYDLLGAWVKKYSKKFAPHSFPVAWIEDSNGNVIEYFVYNKKNRNKVLKHGTI